MSLDTVPTGAGTLHSIRSTGTSGLDGHLHLCDLQWPSARLMITERPITRSVTHLFSSREHTPLHGSPDHEDLG
ncbi:hypothetical protein VTI74DRAFT_8974 [Chaetomium olivicolor]